MIASRRTCLQPDELRQALDGKLPKDEFESAISHLDQCETCRDAAETLESPMNAKTFEASIPDDSEQAAALQNETACKVALQGLLERASCVAESSKSQPPPFETLGPYRLLELLGSGGMGAVYLAEHQRLKRQCAIKVLPPERVNQSGWLDRFDREMTTIASLEHPNIVRATDAGHESGWHYLVMEYLDGLDVGRVAGRTGQLDVGDACEIVRQAALGLAHIHDSGLVHRDIKPSNLMLTQSGTVKLLDLGLVLDGDDPLSKDDRLTTVGHVMGTMPYMAPEQLADCRDVRPQSDIYSLGATLYRLIAGHPPHRDSRGLASQVLAITNQDAKPLDSLRDDIDRAVVELVAEMLSRDPAKRPASALDIAKRLEPAAKQSRLKRLIRNAMRTRETSDIPRSILLPPSQARPDSGGKSRVMRWLMGCAAAALILLAAIVVKIQTDVGVLVVHSDQDDLTIVVKRGAEVVERLKVESGKDNRKTLRKGTYQIQIEGGREALVLSDEVVTIARGTEEAIDVVNRSPSPPHSGPWIDPVVDQEQGAPVIAYTEPAGGGFAVPGATAAPAEPVASGDIVASGGFDPGAGALNAGAYDPNDAGAEIANVDMAPAATTDPETPDRIPAPPTAFTGEVIDPAEMVSHDGVSLREWLKQVESGKEAEKIGEAAFGAIGALQVAQSRGLANDYLSNQVIVAIIDRAREFGGIRSKLPPLQTTTPTQEVKSEHFMWYLSQVFAEPHFDKWFVPTINELAHGNSNSQAALIYCLHRHLKNLQASGLIGAYPAGPGQPVYNESNRVVSKFRVSRLVRCCLSLSAEDAWPELSAEDSKAARAMARSIILNFPNSMQVSVPSEVYDQVIAQIAKIPAEERTEEELQLVPAEMAVNASVNAAPTTGETDFEMAEPVADFGGLSASQNSFQKPLLFQGKDLLQWIDTLERERDVASLGLAMKAVELLTREADHESRQMVAGLSLRLSRRLGGIFAGGENAADPSERFMTLFPQVFTAYFPDPGLDLISEEFAEGNIKSQMASLMLLSNYLSEIEVQPMPGGIVLKHADPQKVDAVERWAKKVMADPKKADALRALRDQMLQFAKSTRETRGSDYLALSAADMAVESAIHLSLLLGDPLQEDSLMREQVRERVEELQELAAANSGGDFGSSQITLLSDALLIAAGKLAQSDPTIWKPEDWNYMASVVVSPQRSSATETFGETFNLVAKNSGEELLQKIHEALANPWNYQYSDEVWGLFISFYAEQFAPADVAGDRLEQFRKTMNVSPTSRTKLHSVIEEAVKTVEGRIADQAEE